MDNKLKLVHRGLILVCVPLIFELVLVGFLLNQSSLLEAEIAREKQAKSLLNAASETIRQYYKIGNAIAEYFWAPDQDKFIEIDSDIKKLPQNRQEVRDVFKTNPAGIESLRKHAENILVPLEKFEAEHLTMLRDLMFDRLIISKIDSSNEFKDEMDSFYRDRELDEVEYDRTFSGDYNKKMKDLLKPFKGAEKESPLIQAKIREQEKLGLGVALIVSVIMALQLAFFFVTGIQRRLFTITDNILRLKESRELNQPISGKDEIALVDTVFHEMTRALNEAREKERQMLQKIMMAEARVRSMIENMPVGLITLTESSAIDGINPRVEELFHLDADHLIGKQLDPLFENPAGADKSILQTLLSTGEGSKSEYVALKDDGTTFYSELSINTFETFEGKRYLLSIQDVTERHELERLKQEFYAMIAHDLRTPLMSAQLSIGVINDGILGEVNPKIRTSLERAETGIKRLTTLINDFLDFEKLQSGKFDLNCKQMLLSSLIDRSVSEVKGLLDKYGLQIETPDMDAITYADEDRLIQVMINFLSNAIKFSPEKSTIRIDAEMIDKEILVSVIDQGPGIPPQLQEKLFKSFSMLKNQSSNVKIKGTGLGLAICKMIVEQHGGSIGVNSKEGEGSTFWFKIPIKES